MSLDNNNGGSMVSAILGDLDKPAAPVNHNTDMAIDESQDLLLVANEDEVEIDDSFSLDGFQVVRREFFAHTFEPSISMQDNRCLIPITFSSLSTAIRGLLLLCLVPRTLLTLLCGVPQVRVSVNLDTCRDDSSF